MKQALIVGRQVWSLLRQVPQSLSALLFCGISQVRFAGSWSVASAPERLDGVWGTTTRPEMRGCAKVDRPRWNRSFPGLTSHPSDSVAYPIWWCCKWDGLERCHSGVLKVGHVCSPQMTIHLLSKGRSQLELSGSTWLLVRGQWRA